MFETIYFEILSIIKKIFHNTTFGLIKKDILKFCGKSIIKNDSLFSFLLLFLMIIFTL
ncbi:hypothetical protein JCM6292_2877 [Bacteroides pyogenes JCM 6292]|uniref:Uncharacterized protein n=2 Tax=Bacteroides pyogenes TaxID=310300 RepID=W4PDS0_9BACE|nr:hypothetical protein JCM6292_2877 [Bacteroides pyogenes JCM 6292]GAE17921.1 hypothetical protein JCM6294_737 [Bacteroides pyogenes DSM 20611 = JCM 6294]